MSKKLTLFLWVFACGSASAAPIGFAACQRNKNDVTCLKVTSSAAAIETSTPPELDSSSSRPWVADVPVHASAVIYFGQQEANTPISKLARAAKPYVTGATYFASLFTEPLTDYKEAAINRNASVDQNIGSVRNAATTTAAALATAFTQRNVGLPQVTKDFGSAMTGRMATNQAIVADAQQLTNSIKNLPAQPMSQLQANAFSTRDRLPPAVAAAVEKTGVSHTAIGSANALGDQSVRVGLQNAVVAEENAYEKLGSMTLQTARARQGLEALRQANYLAGFAPAQSRMLLAEARGARAVLAGEAKSSEVAAWDQATNGWQLMAPADGQYRLLTYSAFLGRNATYLRLQLEQASGGLAQRPPDSTLGVTERLVEEAEAQLASDPTKSLNGLFRARTLMENAKLYGDFWQKLNKWSKGASDKLKKMFEPGKEPPSISKKFIEALSQYSKGLEAGQYALMGIDKTAELFGNDALNDLKSSLGSAVTAAQAEAGPLSELNSVAPSVELWLSNSARVANETNSRAEIAELTKLQTLFGDRIEVLQDYDRRLDALGQLAGLYGKELDNPLFAMLAAWKCASTMCAYDVVALQNQLSDVNSLSTDARKAISKAIERYKANQSRIDQIIDGWLIVLPDPPVIRSREGARATNELNRRMP